PFSSPNPASPATYALSLHDALPISRSGSRPESATTEPDGPCAVDSRGTYERGGGQARALPVNAVRKTGVERGLDVPESLDPRQPDRKSTRLNSSHLGISYAVFCLKK